MKFTVETVKRKNRLGLKSADFYLVAVLLIITAGLLAWIQFGVKKQGETVVIKVDGNVVKQLALKNDTEFDVSGYQGGMNHIVIQDNAVYMSDADCPDKLCVHQGKIQYAGQSIICLPNKVSVTIEDEQDKNGVDAVAQ